MLMIKSFKHYIEWNKPIWEHMPYMPIYIKTRISQGWKDHFLWNRNKQKEVNGRFLEY